MSTAREPAVGKGSGISPLPPRQSLTEDVYESIKALIMDDVIPPEGRLSIDQLARDLRVSSTPVREALVRLESESLVRKEPLRGYSTTPLLTADQLEDLFEFRGLIEPWSAARAAQRIDDAGLAVLWTELDSVTAVPAGDDYAAYRELAAQDERFHQLIAELSGNGEVVHAFTRTHCHLRLFRLRYTTDQGRATLAEHRAIAEAITARDPEAAHAAMTTHLDLARARLSEHRP
ncbi:DNA-binding transcriptional regulator, GntR family [Actinokineospora alba]|uniref:DNA-binding transcriptional regulator, GntR family n=1 Tax=Actinokineospora alba TaxID=504798 RepID=A0A1H0FEA0_9PSEU|nr:GntR family transcriptional regulator [Actinokineospora alba]TDP69445.1 DNA-binding GntR family transcriptional regulator [Actinokineospora alba]SDI16669.1 DNA-binding transcriptional regulator, GntR family [Actinokineospora alba]SDN92954.1 DNA-binding transcriptional regulator, GntR family [Actinokineospora alba]